MDQIEFIKLVAAIRENCGLDCFGPTYYIFIYKDLRRAIVNKTGYVNMKDIGYIIAVCAYHWKNWGYTNSSLMQLVMVDHDFIPVDKIIFGNWAFVEVGFSTRSHDWYNKYKPYPHLELISDPTINNYKPMTEEELERIPEWEWKCQSIEDFETLLSDIDEFSSNYPL